MSRTKQAVLSNTKVLCPCCGYALIVGATVRLKATRELGQMPLQLDGDQASAVAAMAEEAARHG